MRWQGRSSHPNSSTAGSQFFRATPLLLHNSTERELTALTVHSSQPSVKTTNGPLCTLLSRLKLTRLSTSSSLWGFCIKVSHVVVSLFVLLLRRILTSIIMNHDVARGTEGAGLKQPPFRSSSYHLSMVKSPSGLLWGFKPLPVALSCQRGDGAEHSRNDQTLLAHLIQSYTASQELFA